MQGGRTSRPIKTPKIVDKNLAYFIGFVLAEKTISGNNLVVAQKRDISSFYSPLCRKLFGIKPSVEKRNGYHYFTITSKVVNHLLRTIFGFGKSIDARVPITIMKSPNQILAAFLAGVVDGDGGVRENRIYICTASERFAREMSVDFLAIQSIPSTSFHEQIS